MINVKKIQENFKTNNGEPKTLADGFIAVLENNEKIEISGTEWETEDNRSDVENGLCFSVSGKDLFLSNDKVNNIKNILG